MQLRYVPTEPEEFEEEQATQNFISVEEAACGAQVLKQYRCDRPQHRELQVQSWPPISPKRRCVVGGLFALAVFAFAACKLDAVAAPRALPAATRPRASVAEGAVQLRALDMDGRCQIFEDVDLPGNDIISIPYIISAETCCTKCQEHDVCLAWTWNKHGMGPGSDVCTLKGAVPRTLTKVPSSRVISGISRQPEKDGAPIALKERTVGQSLYCYALLQPDSYEIGLMTMQYEVRAGIYNCDEYAVYSNRRLQVAPGVFTGIVNSTLKCPMGGEFGTALNTGIFLALWAKVIMDGRFLYHDWTVKADPDTVFFPDRLRSHVALHKEAPEGVYLNNCQFGLHGPIEVFSRNAVRSWALGAGDCVTFFTELCSGPCGWGEDMFIDQCLLRKLKAQRVDDYGLLLEAHCAPPVGWDSCTNSSVVAFHPFKKEEDWQKCLTTGASTGNMPDDVNSIAVRKLSA